MDSEYVIFCFDNEKNAVLTRAAIEKKSCREILQILEHPDSVLFLHTQQTERALSPDELLVDKYPFMITKTRGDPFSRPLHYVQVVDYQCSNYIKVYIPLKASNYENLPVYPLKVDPLFFKGKKWKELEEYISEVFPYKTSEISVLLGDRKPQPRTSTDYILKYIRTTPIRIECTLTEEQIQKCNHRNRIIEEILETEQTYIDSLNDLIYYWKPELTKRKMFSEEEMNYVFGQIPGVLNTHQNFFKHLSDRGVNFSSCPSGVFLEFVQFFKIVSNYISQYPRIFEITHKKYQNDQAVFDKLAGDKQPLSNLIIMPIQRMPRYILFLRELDKYTPEGHPDEVLLKFAKEQFDVVTKEIEKIGVQNDLCAKATALQDIVPKSIKVVTPGRQLMRYSQCQINPPSKTTGIFYIFNDLVILTEGTTKKQTFLYASETIDFNYTIGDPTETSIVFLDSLVNTLSIFGDSRKMYHLVLNQKEFDIAIKLMTEEKARYDSADCIWWSNIVAQWPECVNSFGAVAFSIGKKIYLYGGYSGQKPLSSFYVFDTETNTFTELNYNIEKHPKHRSGHSMVSAGNCALIAGGVTRSRFLNDIWKYDASANRWDQVDVKGDMEGAFGRSMAMYGDKLILFGGRCKKRATNSLIIIDLSTGILKSQDLPNAPCSRYYHTANVVGDIMYIIGGRDDNTVFNDIYRLDLKSMRWSLVETTGDNLSPRYAHAAIRSNRILFIIGGTTDNGEFTQALDVDRCIIKNVPNTGDCPNYLQYFALAPVDGRPYVFGGCEPERKFIFPGVRTLRLPNITNKNESRHCQFSANKNTQGNVPASASLIGRKIALSKVPTLAGHTSDDSSEYSEDDTTIDGISRMMSEPFFDLQNVPTNEQTDFDESFTTAEDSSGIVPLTRPASFTRSVSSVIDQDASLIAISSMDAALNTPVSHPPRLRKRAATSFALPDLPNDS